MRKQITLAAAVTAAVLIGGTGIDVGKAPPPQTDGAAYLKALLDPVQIARQLCSQNEDGYASRRAPFLRMARLYAAEMSLDGDSPPAPMLWTGLGDLEIAITTSSPEAQAYFNQGLSFANDFNHGAAVRSFRWAQKLDPDCAMCFWGEALALGPN
ncbi:unnamed protein product, partial [Ectocarpus sp. 12 AP-2014]